MQAAAKNISQKEKEACINGSMQPVFHQVDSSHPTQSCAQEALRYFWCRLWCSDFGCKAHMPSASSRPRVHVRAVRYSWQSSTEHVKPRMRAVNTYRDMTHTRRICSHFNACRSSESKLKYTSSRVSFETRASGPHKCRMILRERIGHSKRNGLLICVNPYEIEHCECLMQ